MNKKVFNIIIDIVLITCIFALVDILSLKVFRTENILLDIGLYIVLYILVFGAKRGIVTLWKRKKVNASADHGEEYK